MAPGVGMSLEARALVGVMGIMLIAVCACAILAARVVDARLLEAKANSAASAGARLAYLVRPGMVGAERAEIERWVDDTMRDPRIMFVVVSDTADAPISRHVRDSRSWAAHDASMRLTPVDRRALNSPEPLLADGDIKGYVYRTPVWNDTPDAAKRHLGYVTVAYMDPSYALVRAGLLRATAMASLIAALGAAPLVFLAARRLTRPLRRMANAASQLAAGERPERLNERGPMEIVTLAKAFNRMATGLSDARESLVRANRELESVVRARTAELGRTNQLLRAEIHEKNEFVRSVSHDLGAPLRNISGMADMLLANDGGDLGEDARTKIERIRANAHLEQNMLSELLELSRIGARPECPDIVPVRDVVDEVARALAHEMGERGVTLEAHDPLPTLRVERARLRHVVQNLVDNAVKYMGDRPVRRIDISGEVNAGGARLVISDTGPGIPERERESVFHIFRRASTSVGAAHGVGVGLASVKAVVERWGGTISLEGVAGGGSRFIVRIPADRVTTEEASQAA